MFLGADQFLNLKNMYQSQESKTLDKSEIRPEVFKAYLQYLDQDRDVKDDTLRFDQDGFIDRALVVERLRAEEGVDINDLTRLAEGHQ